MLPLNSQRVFLAVGSTDMRKSVNGLSLMVEGAMGHNPFSGDLFVFCNRRRTIIKILYFDHNGFCLWLKRLEEHRFKWPKARSDVLMIGVKELTWLLAGLDYTSAHQKLQYAAVG